MKTDPIVLRGALRALQPILTALALLSVAQGGSGLAAAGLVVLGVFGHAIFFGADAATRAVPPGLWRIACAGALIAGAVSVGSPDWDLSPMLGEAALLCATVAACALALTALIGRAPTLRDEEW